MYSRDVRVSWRDKEVAVHRQQREIVSLEDRLWGEAPSVRELLEAADTLTDAREAFRDWLDRIEDAAASEDRTGAERLDAAQQAVAIQTLRGFLSMSNETVAETSTLETLWDLARGTRDAEGVPGFVDEFNHLFRAAHGRSDVGRGWLGKDPGLIARHLEHLPEVGRRAGKHRSRFLDEAAGRVLDRTAAFPSGLDPELTAKRAAHAARIREALGASEKDWNDWEWQAHHVLKGREGFHTLRKLVPLRLEEATAVHEAVRAGVAWGITPYYLSLFDFASSARTNDAQVRAQVMPPLQLVQAMVEHQADRDTALDFMGEHDTSPMERITRRYPHVAILKVCGTCPQVCSYCQRNWEIDDAMMWERLPSREDLDPALDWFAEHPAVFDVLITGGDPFILPDDVLFHVLDRLAAMPHIQHVRIGTRVPVTLPMRVTKAFAERLGSTAQVGVRNVSVVTHVESGLEVTPELAQAVNHLRRAGITVFNQLVFTVYASRRFQTVATRMALNRAGIVPYYTFYTKGKSEHRDYLVPIARILQERKEEARLLPGIVRTDEPVFNVPRLGKHHLRAAQDREWIAIRPDGRRVYLIHPWEKGIAPVEPWSYADVSIRAYLQRMASLGEDLEDYDSIWYYS